MAFICKRCNQEFLHKAYLKSHLERKRICDFIDNDYDVKILIEELYKRNLKDKTYDCEYCGMKFNSTSGKCQHKKNCKDKPKGTETIVNELSEQVKKLQSKIEELQIPNAQNITNNTTNNNNTQNINITVPKLKNFGWENMDAIPESLVSSLFMNLRFKELLANLHCDPNFPENQNVRIKSVKRNTMEIYRNNKWDIVTFTKGLTDLLLQGHKIFTDYYNKDKKRILEEDMDEQDLREILSQLQKIQDLNKSEIKPLIDELQMMLEEYRENGHAIVLA